MTIQRKFYIFLAILGVVFLSQSLALVVGESFVEEKMELQHSKIDPLIETAYQFQFHVVQIQQWLSDISATRGLDGLDDGMRLAEKHFNIASDLLDQLNSLQADVNTSTLHGTLKQYYQEGVKMAEAYIEGGPSSGNALMANFDASASRMTEEMNVLLASVRGTKAATVKNINTEIESLTVTIQIGVVVNFLVLGLMLWMFKHQLFNPIQKFHQAVASLSSGELDLKERLSITGEDEISLISRDFNKILDKIAGVVNTLVERTRSMKGVSDQLKSVAEKTTHEAYEQQQQINLVATALTELLTSVEGVDSNASETSDQLRISSERLDQGFENIKSTEQDINTLVNLITSTAEVVSGLQTRTNEIESMLGMIKSVAEQTNLLALNAAIEAARAGEQGRGFAVVADEVRALASRTQDSTTEINTIITQLQEISQNTVSFMSDCVNRAEKTVESARETLNNIEYVHQSMDAISHQTTEISHSINEQKSVIEEHTKTAHHILEASRQTVKLINGIQSSINQIDANADEFVEITNLLGAK